jgi:hypothetical protein
VKSGQGEVQMVSNSQEKNPKEKRWICYLESRRCRVVNFLDGLALPAEGQKSHPRQQTRVLEMTSTESHPARLRPTTADHCPYQPSLIKGGGVAEACEVWYKHVGGRASTLFAWEDFIGIHVLHLRVCS